METHERILSMKMYQSGDHFDAWTVAQRLGLPINKVRHACDRLVQNTLLVKHVREKKSTMYSRPLLNKWLCKPWVTYYPPRLKKHELTPSTALIYGRPYDR